jgi:hypothetical protein
MIITDNNSGSTTYILLDLDHEVEIGSCSGLKAIFNKATDMYKGLFLNYVEHILPIIEGIPLLL